MLTFEPDLIGFLLVLSGMVATFVRVEQRGKANREEVQALKTEMQRQHTDLGSTLSSVRSELRDDVRILFKTSNEQDKRIERLLTVCEQHEKRVTRVEGHVDKIGGQLGIGNPAS